MKNKYNCLALIIFLLFFSQKVNAQLENVIVENYYVSDSNDATDTISGLLERGTKTYRIYIDLKPGYSLKKLFGDPNHRIKISSSEVFYNNTDRGQSFGNSMSKSWLNEGTVALDSWLTLGQCTKNSVITYFGVLKSKDTGGSFIGGINNDGGISAIPGGLLVNAEPLVGIPLTDADGFEPFDSIPQNWLNYGIIDTISYVDSTIFGSAKLDSIFESNYAGIQNTGVSGVIPEDNQVLVAQLTTKGDISFELNIEVVDSNGNSTVIVAQGVNSTSGDTLVNPYLNYPLVLVCGCTDPEFLEYNSSYSCNIQDSCKTRIVYGCMDPKACNYNENANFNIQTLCCYPGYCNDRNLQIVCPDLISLRNNFTDFKLFPNPANNNATFQVSLSEIKEISYELYNSYGQMVKKNNLGFNNGFIEKHVDIRDLSNGLYILRLKVGDDSVNKTIEIQ